MKRTVEKNRHVWANYDADKHVRSRVCVSKSVFFHPVFCIHGGKSILEQEKKRKEGVSDLQKLPTITTVSPVYTYYNQNSFHMAFFWCRNGRRIRRTQAVRSYWVGWTGRVRWRETFRGVATRPA